MDQGNGQLPFAAISDHPSLPIRGIMLDIGRDKIPSMDTLYQLIDLFSNMGINHLQLYMEGFCFDYKEYRYLFSDETPLTGEEFKALGEYAKARFIDLVPNQNVLGHMEKWLDKPQLNNLAECPQGFLFENLFWRPPMTLDVYNQESFALAKDLLDSLLENSFSDYVNVNMDEPFEMGRGKNQETASEHGRLKLYFDYLDKLHSYCSSKNKKMLMWGDEILHNPESIQRFPKDVTLLDWIYEGDAHFEEHAKLMEKTGLSYCLCPGTSSWGSLTGRSDNMKKNIRDAASCAIQYGGKGIITTDWGDLGHWQYISTSYPGFAFTAQYSWAGVEGEDWVVPWYLNRYVYQSPDGTAYEAAYALGNYYHLEQAPLYNTTLSFAVISSKYYFDSLEEFDEKIERLLTLSANIARTNHIPERDKKIFMNYEELKAYLDHLEGKIEKAAIQSSDGPLIKAEMKNGLHMVMHGARLYYTLKELREQKALFASEMQLLFQDLDRILKEHYRLWTARNRVGGFKRSTAHMLHLLEFYNKMSR